jgi:hypothetical protein
MTIVNDASSGVNNLKASLNDAARGVIYDRHVFIIQATGFDSSVSITVGWHNQTPLAYLVQNKFSNVGCRERTGSCSGGKWGQGS